MPKSKSKTPNKSAFVRNLPGNMSAKDVVAKAKAQGITLTENYVYTIRSAAKTKARKGGSGRGPGRPKGTRGGASSGSEQSFIEHALDIGLGNAEKLLAKLRARIRSVALD